MIKYRSIFYIALVACGLLSGCKEKQPTPPKQTEGLLRGKVSEPSTLPIAGAQINLGYELGQQTAPPAHRVKMPSPDFVLEQNYPNPYNPVSTFQFLLRKPARVVLKVLPRIYAANVIATVVDMNLSAGHHQVSWNSLLPDSMLITNGNHLFRMQALEGELVVFEDERYLFHNSVDAAIVPRMKPLAMTDVNGDFSISYAETSIGDTLAYTSAIGPEILGGMVISDSISVFVSKVGYKTATQRVKFGEKEAPVVNVVLERL